MAAELGWVGLGVSADFTGFKGDVDRETSKVMGAAGATGGDKFGTAAGKSAGAKFKSAITSAAKVAAVGLAAGAALAFKFGRDSLEEAREAAKVGALTASTIKATGGAAKVSAKHVADLSGAISEKVGIDDEAIQSGANMLLTFKNIRNEAGAGNEIFDQSLATLTDMSAAMGTDAKSSAIQLGKALNDPVKGISALSRVGVTFTEEQKKQIEQLVKHGDALGAQKIILRELNSEFRGAAASQADSGDKLAVSWGNLKEEVGTELMPVMDDLATFLRRKGIPAARDFFGWVKDTGVPAMKDFADEISPVVGHVKDLAGFINDLPKEIKIGGLAGVAGLFAAAKLRGGRGGALGSAGSALGMTRPIPVFVTNAGGLGGGTGGKPGAGINPAAALAFAPHSSNTPEDLAPHLQLNDKPLAGQLDTLFDKPLKDAGKFKGALDLVGAKKVNPDLRIPNILNEQNRLASFDSVLDLVGSKKIRPHVEVTGIDHARAEIDGLADALAGVVTGAGNALDDAIGTIVGPGRGRNGPRPRNHGRDRQRAANLGGHP